jgi:molecular chaperone GrpE
MSSMSEKVQRPNDGDASGAEFPENHRNDREAGPGPAHDQPENGETMSAAAQIAQLKQERDELRDQALRARAEFANYQKRAKQQADTERAYAVGSLAKDLLEPLDNLDRAIEALRAKGAEGVTAGLDMVQKQLLDIMAKHGVQPISAHGHPFDPNLHDAILQQPSLEHPEGTVVAELSKGYTIADRVLRPSKVAVSVKPTSQGE